jgi:hypothetical protein
VAVKPAVQEKLRLPELPELPGWTNFTGAAQVLGVTRARVYQMVEERKIKSARRVPYTKIYLVRIAELEKIKQDWAQEAKARLLALAR